MTPGTRLLPFAALAAGVVAIAWSAMFVRWAHMPGIASAFYRMLLAAVLVWIILRARNVPARVVSGKALRLAAIGGAFFAGDVGCYNIAVLHTTAGGATFLGNNAPLLVGILTWILTKKLPSGAFWTGLLLGSIGAWLIVYVDRTSITARTSGDVLAVLASICFALYLVVTENLRREVDTFTLVALSTTASAIALFLFAIVTGTALTVPSGSALASLAGLGLVCQFAGYSCLTYALGHLPATISSIVLLAVAPLAAVLALLCFHERMTTLQWFGGVLILSAVWVVSRQRSPRSGLP